MVTYDIPLIDNIFFDHLIAVVPPLVIDVVQLLWGLFFGG